MIQPSDPDLRVIAVRNGHQGPVTCVACGCRLAAVGDGYMHFNAIGGRDARGDLVDCADAVHDATGRPIAVAV